MKRGIYVVMLLVAIYVASYSLLSTEGRYRSNTAIAYEVFGRPCFCISDQVQWQPLHVASASAPGDPQGKEGAVRNALGIFFAPLVYLDQRYWHPNNGGPSTDRYSLAEGAKDPKFSGTAVVGPFPIPDRSRGYWVAPFLKAGQVENVQLPTTPPTDCFALYSLTPADFFGVSAPGLHRRAMKPVESGFYIAEIASDPQGEPDFTLKRVSKDEFIGRAEACSPQWQFPAFK